MAIYSTDFSEYTTGIDLSDWTDFYGTGTVTFEAGLNTTEPFPAGTKYLELNASATDKNVVTWDDVGNAADVDIVCSVDHDFISNCSGTGVVVRASGTAGNEDGYLIQLSYTVVRIYKLVAGVATVLITETFLWREDVKYWVRFRANGTDLKAKVWAGDAVEPEDWTLETTDSSHSTGAVGVMCFTNAYKVWFDYFECVTISGSATYPPSGLTDNNAFRTTYISHSTHDYLDSGRALGGLFNGAGRKLKGVGIYCTDHSDDIRIAVYSGGALATGPAGATLLKDFGKTSGVVVDDFVQIFTTDDINVPDGDPLWIVIKGDNAAGFEFTYTIRDAECGDYQKALGRCNVLTPIGKDPDVAFDATFPAGAVSFANYWYNTQIYLDGHPDAPTVDSTTVGVATAVKNGTLNSISVAMPYTGDDNANNTYTVDYKLAAAGGWTNWVTGAAHSATPYETTITSLLVGELYDVKCTYVDADGVWGTNPQEIDDIQLDRLFTCQTGFFSFAGQDIEFTRGIIMACQTGTFVLTGQDAEMTQPVVDIVDCQTGAFTLTGQSADLTRSVILECQTGVFTLTGQDMEFNICFPLECQTGAFTLTGQNANLTSWFTLGCQTTAFTLTGQDINITRSLILECLTGVITLTGQDAVLARSFPLVCNTGMFILTGQDITLTETFTLSCQTGAFALTGQDINLARAYFLECDPGTFALTGQDAGLGRTGLLSCSAGTFTLTGQDLDFSLTYSLVMQPGGFVLTGQDINLLRSRNLLTSTGVFTLTGQDATFNRIQYLECSPGAFILTGQSADLPAGRLLTPQPGGFVLTGQDAELDRNYTLECGVGTFLLTGQDLTLQQFYSFLLQPGEFNLTGQDLVFIQGVVLECDTGVFTLTGQEAGLGDRYKLTVETGEFLLAGGDMSILDFQDILAGAVEMPHAETVTEFEHPGFWVT